jgi:ABC-type phosphate/phosphonate transport system permease subunit
MKSKIFSFLEMVYVVIYFLIAVIAGIILYPLSFLSKKNHFEESGYDV